MTGGSFHSKEPLNWYTNGFFSFFDKCHFWICILVCNSCTLMHLCLDEYITLPILSSMLQSWFVYLGQQFILQCTSQQPATAAMVESMYFKVFQVHKLVLRLRTPNPETNPVYHLRPCCLIIFFLINLYVLPGVFPRPCDWLIVLTCAPVLK